MTSFSTILIILYKAKDVVSTSGKCSIWPVSIIDLSGIANMEMHVIDHFQKILTGISMMGCKVIITGLRAELVRTMIHSGISFEDKAEAKGTLQQTLKEYLELHQM
ncbi:anti-anti-sigma regulatory factor [Priestia megaterium]